METLTPFLQYGFAGVLVVVLGFGFKLFREYVHKSEERMTQSLTFTQDLVTNALETQRQGIEAQRELLEAIGQLNKRFDMHEKAADARIATVIAKLEV